MNYARDNDMIDGRRSRNGSNERRTVFNSNMNGNDSRETDGDDAFITDALPVCPATPPNETHRGETTPSSFKFTLIELLVVVAIIMILFSLLLPSLKSAKEFSKRSVCSGNMKQLGQGLMMYTSDNDEWYPTRPTTNDWFLSWDAKIAPYFNLGGTTIDDSMREKTIFWCPSMIKEGPAASSTANRSYISHDNLGDTREVCDYLAVRKSGDSPSPSVLGNLFETWLCSRSLFGPKTRSMYLESQTTGKQEFRHNNGEMILFFDAHVDWRKMLWVEAQTNCNSPLYQK